MFNLFTGKISGVLTLALQGISKLAGEVLNLTLSIVDTVVETVNDLTAPLTKTLVNLPVIGETLTNVFDVKNNLVNTLGENLHTVADQLSEGNLTKAIETGVNGLTQLTGQIVGDVANLLDYKIDLPLVESLPLSNILDAVNETNDNIVDSVKNIGSYISDIHPTELLTNAITDPSNTLINVIKDVSTTVDDLLDNFAPITNALHESFEKIDAKITQNIYDISNYTPPIQQDLVSLQTEYI